MSFSLFVFLSEAPCEVFKCFVRRFISFVRLGTFLFSSFISFSSVCGLLDGRDGTPVDARHLRPCYHFLSLAREFIRVTSLSYFYVTRSIKKD